MLTEDQLQEAIQAVICQIFDGVAFRQVAMSIMNSCTNQVDKIDLITNALAAAKQLGREAEAKKWIK